MGVRRRVSSAAVLIVVAVGLVAVPAAPSGAVAVNYDVFDADASGRDMENAYLLALLSHYVYRGLLGDDGVSDADFEQAFVDHFTPLGLTDFTYVNNVVFDTEIMVAETADAVIVTFRGTETAEAQDFIDLATDVNALHLLGMHLGFAGAAATSLPPVHAAIQAAGEKKVWLTGHSLGGALATVSARLLETDPTNPIDVQGVVTFGAPRTFLDGPLDFVTSAYETAMGAAHQRWVNNDDPVPHLLPYVPVLAQYRHPAELNHITVADGACAFAYDTSEVALISQADIDAVFAGANWLDAGDIATRMGSYAGELAGYLADHDTDRYATRIFSQLPAESRAVLPVPPLPASPQGDCDELPDASPPVVVPSVVGPVGNAGWYTGDVTVSWNVSDGDSDVISQTGCGETVVDTDTSGTTLTCTASSVGGTTTDSVVVKRDATPPSGVAAAADRPADHNGWYNAPLTVTWSGSDGTSGVASCTQTSYSTPDTAAASLSGTCSDVAGNVSSPVAYGFKFDDTNPTVSLVRPVDGADYFRDQAVLASYSCQDATSGADTCTGPVASGGAVDTGAFGSQAFTVVATDEAGNTASSTNTYTVTYAFSGFAAPVENLPATNRAKAGRTVPFKWTMADDGGPVVNQAALFDVGWGGRFACSGTGGDAIEEYATAGLSGLRWDAEAQQYVFTAASAKGDAGFCRYLIVRVGDHASFRALVSFIK